MRPALSLVFALCLASSFALGQVQRGEPLPRKGFLGVASQPIEGGVRVVRIVPGGTAEKLGLKAEDVILAVNGKPTPDPATLGASTRGLNTGAPVEVKYRRDGKDATVKGALLERPKQQEANLDVIYDQVVSQGKRIRVIATKPKGEGKFPTVFLIGGIGAYSVDAPFAAMPYGNIIGPIANAGFATVRIDKPGQGDSEGPAEYKGLGFAVEQDAYLQALRLAKTLPFVDPNRIAIFGHSMGGCFGPLVVAQETVKALIVNGTVIKSWNEYMFENTRRQSELKGMSLEQIDAGQKQLGTMVHLVFDEGLSPQEAATKRPDLADYLKSNFANMDTYSGVGVPFWQELSKINLPRAWSGVKSNVLVLYGENDFLSGRDDHERIAAYVNSLRPGTAEFKLLEGSDHGFKKTTSQKDSLDRWGQPGGEFNPSIVETLLAYLKKQLG
jgi:uncharacterized protein